MQTVAVLSHKSDILLARVIGLELSLRGIRTVSGEIDGLPDDGADLIAAVCRTESESRKIRDTASEQGVPCLICGGDETGADLVLPMVIGDFIQKAVALLEEKCRPAVQTPVTAPVRDIEINAAARKASYAGEEIPLSSREFDLLLYLYEHRGQTVTRSELRENVWGSCADTNNTDVYIRYLRSKLDERFDTHFIETVRGTGYRLRTNG